MSQTRIKAVANLIENNNIVVDIGSDHALLSLILINEKRAQHVINIEKNDLPFRNSIKATKSFNKQITNKKSNGFDSLEPFIFIDTCTIMGMGGNSIINILNNSLSRNIEKFILQPNNNEKRVRNWIKQNNWRITFEDIIKENEIIYEILVLSKIGGYVPNTNYDELFGRINIANNKDLFREKWIQKLSKIIEKNLDKFNDLKAKEADLIRKVLNDECKAVS